MRNRSLRIIIGWIAAGFIHLVWISGWWRTVGAEIPAAYWDANRPFILAFWHGRLMMMPYCWRRGVPLSMLISQHRDGDFIARTVSHLGLGAVRGSSAKPGKKAKGGAGAFRYLIKQLALGEYVGITPDGPSGPRMRADSGVISLARLSGAPIIAVSFAARWRTHTNSWDKFLIAWPFSRGVFVWGGPIHVPPDTDSLILEQARLELEQTLNRITAEADRLCGHHPVEPVPIGPQHGPLQAGS